MEDERMVMMMVIKKGNREDNDGEMIIMKMKGRRVMKKKGRWGR